MKQDEIPNGLFERVARLEVRAAHVEGQLASMDVKLDDIISRLDNQKGFVRAVGIFWAVGIGAATFIYNFFTPGKSP